MVTTLKLKVANRWFLENLSLELCTDILSQTSIQVIDSKAQYITTQKIYGKYISFFKCILTSNIHINCLVLWFTKAIVRWTIIFSCISPVNVFYIQHLSFLHHNSISLVPRLLLCPGDVWFWSTQSVAG